MRGVLLGGIPHFEDLHLHRQFLAGQGMIAIHGQPTVFNLGNEKALHFTHLVLHLHLSTQLSELGWDILDIIREGQIRIVVAKPMRRRKPDRHLVTHAFPGNGFVHTPNQLGLAAVDVIDRQVALFKHVAFGVGNRIGQGNEFTGFDSFFRHAYVIRARGNSDPTDGVDISGTLTAQVFNGAQLRDRFGEFRLGLGVLELGGFVGNGFLGTALGLLGSRFIEIRRAHRGVR